MGGGIAKEGPGRGRTLVVSREGKIVAEAGSGTGGRWGCEAAQLERRPLRRAQGPAGNGVLSQVCRESLLSLVGQHGAIIIILDIDIDMILDIDMVVHAVYP